VLEGELTVKRAGPTTILREGEAAVIEAAVWHDWWNASNRNARVRVEVTPGERFSHMVETLSGLARLGHTDNKGMPNVLQLAVFASRIITSTMLVTERCSRSAAVRNASFRPGSMRTSAWWSCQ
jgi:hypothetical protein